MVYTAEQLKAKLASMQLVLPPLPQSKGIYKRVLEYNGLLYVSGHISVDANGAAITGRLGETMTVEEGVVAARQCGLAILAAICQAPHLCERIVQVVKLLGMVNAAPHFGQHAMVLNGCSALFEAVWGPEQGVGVRSAVGMGSLPGGVAVEIEGIFALGPS